MAGGVAGMLMLLPFVAAPAGAARLDRRGWALLVGAAFVGQLVDVRRFDLAFAK